jgi:hypothetical protein
MKIHKHSYDLDASVVSGTLMPPSSFMISNKSLVLSGPVYQDEFGNPRMDVFQIKLTDEERKQLAEELIK